MGGAKPVMKKCSLGKGTMLTASFLQSALSWAGKCKQVVTPLMVDETRWLRSLYMGVVSFSIWKQMLYKALLSVQKASSVFSTKWWTERVALYGSTTKHREM